MRLPRRVPWQSIAELDQVCSWIYTDENDLDATLFAINRLAAWKAITPLPHALDATLSLLAAISYDKRSTPSTNALVLRQSYATAIIRLVNGLVDPLQLGAYARSIAAIAHQLGLPQWLVELRHAATHEDLPSLELLREGARESMLWLLHNYFLPTINPSAAGPPPAALRPLTPLLKQYKTLLKITTRDVSRRTEYNSAITSALRDIERWIAEAKVAANISNTFDFNWEGSGTADTLDTLDLDPKERWALERFSDGLLEKGALVSLSKKKRVLPLDSFLPPTPSILLWEGLLRNVQSLHPDFPYVFVHRVISFLSEDPNSISDTPNDPSFEMCLASWSMWFINNWTTHDSHPTFDLKKEAIASLLYALGPGNMDSDRNTTSVVSLLQALSKGNPSLDATIKTLMELRSHAQTKTWESDHVLEMEKRLAALLALDAPPPHSEEPLETSSAQQGSIPQSRVVSVGWRLLDESSRWKPCPIGVHICGA